MLWLRLRSELRSRWRAWLALGAIAGLAGGLVAGAIAGARRTDTAYDRFLDRARPADAAVACESCDAADLARLPGVAMALPVTTWGPGTVEVRTAEGQPLQPNPDDPGYTGPGEVGLAASTDPRVGTEIERPLVVDGRLPRPDEIDEVAVPRDLAKRVGIEVGDRLVATFFGEVAEEAEAPPLIGSAPLRVVGIKIAPGELEPPSGHFSSFLHLTAAFDRAAATRGLGGDRRNLLVRLREGTEPEALAAQAAQRGLELEEGLPLSEHADLIRRAIRPSAIGLAVFAAVLALVSLGVVGQAASRQAVLESTEHPLLGALGWTRAQLWALATARSAVVGLVAAVVAAVVTVVASLATPIGLARVVDPDTGIQLGAAALAAGSGTFLALLAVAAPAARRVSLVIRSEARSERDRPSTASAVTGRLGLPLAPATGVRMALEPGAGRSSTPVRSSIAGVTVAVAGVTAALVFGASIDHLVRTPRLSGWNWDVAVVPDDPQLVDELTPALERDPAVDGVAPGTYFPPFPSEDHALELGRRRVPVDILGFAAGEAISPTVLDGRAPTRGDEILLGRETLHDVGLDVGDDVQAIALAGEFDNPESLREVAGRFRIVGTGVIPLSGGASRLGRGAVLTLDGIRSLNPEAGPDAVYVRLSSGADPERVAARLAQAIAPAELIGFQLANEVLNVREVEDLPNLLSVVIGLLGAAVLTHFLVTAVRTRRRDLAVLRALGCTGRDLRGIVTTEGVVLALVGAALGIPVGVVIGRWVWHAFAVRLGVAPEPALPVLVLGAVAASVAALAVAIAVLPGRWAARARPGIVLQAG